MTDGMHLGDEVEIITDSFAQQGVSKGAIGVIVDDWADGSNDIEVSDPKTGEVVARFRAAEDQVRPYSGRITVKEPREHGILLDPMSKSHPHLACSGRCRSRAMPLRRSRSARRPLKMQSSWATSRGSCATNLQRSRFSTDHDCAIMEA
jgi:hypothetical protein